MTRASFPDVASLPPLRPQHQSAQQPAQQQPTESADALVRSCLPLVNHLVRDVLNRVPLHVNRDDLASAAMYALASAARSFDPSLGVPFAGYAALRMRGALTDELRSMDWASRESRRRARGIESAATRLTEKLGRTPSSQEVADELGLSAVELSTLRADTERASVLSLHALAPDHDEIAVPSRQDGPEGLLLRREELGYLRDAVAELPERMRKVIEDYFFGQRKMADIAIDLGVTESRVSQLRSEALRMLRGAMQANDETYPESAPEPRRRSDTTARMRDAVAARSTLAQRLDATTLLGESRAELRRCSARAVAVAAIDPVA